MAATRFEVDGATLSITGRWLRIASVFDEAWTPHDGFDLDGSLRALAHVARTPAPDIFTFVQGLSDRTPRHRYAMEWESVAAISLTSFDDWWRRLPWKSRSNARRAQKRGVVASVVAFDDALVHGIVGINNATAVRQGRRFSHFQEPFDVVRRA